MSWQRHEIEQRANLWVFEVKNVLAVLAAPKKVISLTLFSGNLLICHRLIHILVLLQCNVDKKGQQTGTAGGTMYVGTVKSTTTAAPVIIAEALYVVHSFAVLATSCVIKQFYYPSSNK